MNSMQPERRQNRTPFSSTEQGWICDKDGTQIALCNTQHLAAFFCTTANFFDPLTRAARVCLGEYEQLSNPEAYPGYIALKKLVDDYESALRGNH